MPEERAQRRLAAILAADVVGYSRLTGTDEEGTLQRLRALRRELIDPTITSHHGRIVKTTGDGILVEFASVVDAVRCAVAVQHGMASRNSDVPLEHRIEFRVGINLGDVVVEGDDLLGDGVNVAARLEGMAEPGGICLSGDVHRQVKSKIDVHFRDMGDQRLKNIAEPVRVYAIPGVEDEGALVAASRVTTASGASGLALPNQPSIAVLPFQNMSGDPEQEYFADGMVEEIITALSRFKELLVIARNSSFVYKGRVVDIQQVARELGVHYVLEGSVRKANSRVRITGQLIDVATRAHLWADRFDGALEDVFDLQDRVSESVIGALQPTLRRAEMERARRKPPASLDAYDYVLRALPAVIANTTTEAAAAITLLDEALRLYPDYAYAHALLSMAYGQIYRSAAGPEREETRRKSIGHARRVLELTGDDSTALAYAGFILLLTEQDVAGARAALDRAVALNPNSAAAYTYRALVLAATGEPEAAIENASRALRLSPLDPANYMPQMAMVIAHIGLRQYDDAVAWAHKAVESAPPRYPMSYAWLIVAECARGKAAEAERQLKRLAAILPGFGSETLAQLFDIFPEPLRSNSVSVLREAGLVPAAN